LFKKAFLASQENNISKECIKIKDKLEDAKIKEISKNKDIILEFIKAEILQIYYYKEGVYAYNLKNDKAISEATVLLKNEDKYKKILSGN
jgi:carboxyl-terminal processing protease